MNYFDLRKFLAEGGIEARLNEYNSNNPNNPNNKDKKPFNQLTPSQMSPEDTLRLTLHQAGIPESKKEEAPRSISMSDKEFIYTLTKAFSAADDVLSEDLDEGRGRPSGTGRERGVNFKIFTGDRSEENILRLLKKFNELYTSPKNPTRDPKAKKGRTPFSDEELTNLAKLFASGEPVTSKNIMAAIPRYKTSAPANTFLNIMDKMGRSGITSIDKKVLKPTRDPNAPETRGRKKKPEEPTDEEPTDEEPTDEEPTDDQIRKAAKKAGLDEDLSQNDTFLDNLLKKKPLTEDLRTKEEIEEEVADALLSFYEENINFYPNVETFTDEVRNNLDLDKILNAIIAKHSNDVDI